MQRFFLTCIFLLLSAHCLFGQSRDITLEECFNIAEQNNLTVRQMQQSVHTRQYQYDAAKLTALPKIDALGAYTYLSDPIKIDLQAARKGIVNGTSQQNVDAANQVFQEITGNPLSQDAQDAIYKGSQDIINAIYPDYNPSLSQQQYFTAGLALRMPIYLGGKLRMARKVAGKQLESGKLNLQMTENTVNFAVTAQYLKIRYLNSMIQRQQQLLKIFQKTKENAVSLVKNEIIPPYQAHWANVALSQVQTGLSTFYLEKENALTNLQNLLGIDSTLSLIDTLKVVHYTPITSSEGNYWENNIGYRWLQSKTTVAESIVRVNRSRSLPNIFGIANYQFLKKDLPVITPPWMVGVMFQWNIFSSFENGKRVKASHSLVKESELLAQKRKKNLQTRVKTAQNKLTAIRKQMKTLDKARKEAATTVEMVRRRMENQLSSVKDVNDALKIQLGTEKAYYTAILAYDMAVATYLNIIGQPKAIADYLK